MDAARAVFENAMTDSRNLLAIHKDLNAGHGRRFREVSLNRAMVVLTVAAWQAFVQDLVREALAIIAIPPTQPGHAHFRLIEIDAKRAIRSFSTPGPQNTRNLLGHVGVDPGPYWTWWAGPVHYTQAEVQLRMDEWLSVRHAVAHGDRLPEKSVLTRLPSGDYSLTRYNAEVCMNFFSAAVTRTALAVEDALL